MALSRSPHDDGDVGAPERLDEAFGVMRALSPPAWGWWAAGSVPMVLGGLFFWADQTGVGRPVLAPPGWALVLAGLYVWLKITQAFLARAVWATLLPEGGLPALSVGDWFRRTGALVAVAAMSLPVQVVAAHLVLPIGWVLAFSQHATAVAYTQDLGGRPLRSVARLAAQLAARDPLAHHLSLVMLGTLSLMVWLSIFVLGLLLPFLLRILTGVESQFTQSPLAVALSTLYLAVTVGVTWLVVSPYVRVVYAHRTFLALSRQTGDDLLARLHAVRRRAAGGLPLLAALVLCGDAPAAGAEPAAGGEGTGAPSAAPAAGLVEAPALSEAIRQTLDQRDYQWRTGGGDVQLADDAVDGLVGMVKRAIDAIGNALRGLDRLFEDIARAMRRLFGGGPSPAAGAGKGAVGVDGSAWRGALYVAGVVVVAALGWLAWRAWQRRSRVPVAAMTTAAAPGPVNLEDEGMLATALPEDEWLRLAADQCRTGDLRLALRAVFLATLASLGDQRLIEIARSKSNRDYAAELRRRAAARREIPEVFGRSVSVFERAWYGWHEVDPAWLDELMKNHQRLSSRVTAA